MVSPKVHPASCDRAKKAAPPPVDSRDVFSFKTYLPLAQASLLHATSKTSIGKNPLCGNSLFAALHSIRIHVYQPNQSVATGSGHTLSHGRQLRHKYPQFVTALFAFVCTPRTRQELVQLDDEMSECKCKLDSGGSAEHGSKLAALHWPARRATPSVDKDIFKAALAICMHLMAVFLCTVRTGALDNPTITAQSPGMNAISYFLNHRRDETIKMLATWFEYTRCSETMHPLCFCLKLPNFKISLAKSGEFLKPIAHELGCMVTMLKVGHKLGKEEKRVIGDLSLFLWLVLGSGSNPCVAEWFNKDGRGRVIHDHYVFLIDQDIHGEVSLVNQLWNEKPKAGMLKIASLIRGTFPESEPEHGRPGSRFAEVHEVDSRNSEIVMSTEYMGTDIPSLFRRFRESSTCYYPFCESNRPDAPPLKNCPLPRCKGCSLITYCSPACQRLGWDYPAHPHKLICPAVNQLRLAWCHFGRTSHPIEDFAYIEQVLAQAGIDKKSANMWRNADDCVEEVKRSVKLLYEMVLARLELFCVSGDVTQLKLGWTTVEELERELVERERARERRLAESSRGEVKVDLEAELGADELEAMDRLFRGLELSLQG